MYIRKLKKAGKTYSYYYESKRIGDKVKSIYVGRALEEPERKIKRDFEIKKDKNETSAVSHLLEFDDLLNEINKLIFRKDLNGAVFAYGKMFEVYNKMEINNQDKVKVLEKLNNVYSELVNLGEETETN